MRKTTMNINDYLLTSLRDGQSAEDLAKDLSSALQAAEKQLAEEKAAKEQSSQLKTDLCNCLRNYASAMHPKTYNRLIEIHGHDFTDDELIKIIDNTIKNTAVAIKLCDVFDEATTTQNTVTNWEKLFNDFFDKYDL
ncbi:MAG: hypothetical protein MSA89_15840 [Clostridium sp.]|nr:hypothetical protein [Clostridium sp.]MCI7591788.1 hypothetical protein [Lactobacillus johnsonii]MDY4184040.1 hypothetical protein [Candidatus Onthovivens sp.]